MTSIQSKQHPIIIIDQSPFPTMTGVVLATINLGFKDHQNDLIIRKAISRYETIVQTKMNERQDSVPYERKKKWTTKKRILWRSSKEQSTQVRKLYCGEQRLWLFIEGKTWRTEITPIKRQNWICTRTHCEGSKVCGALFFNQSV